MSSLSKFQTGNKTYIIAEIGINHNGNLTRALEMVDAAARAGADCVKFQYIIPEELYTQYPEPDYPVHRQKVNRASIELFQQFCLSEEAYGKLFEHATLAGLDFCATPFGKRSLSFLDALGVSFFKIASSDLTNYPFLQLVSTYNKPVLLSTGMSNEKEISGAVDILRNSGGGLILLHCTSLYPTPVERVNLKRMEALKAIFGLPVGFSDHSIGPASALGAVFMGAQVIERHFVDAYGKNAADEVVSFDENDFKKMVAEIRLCEQILGDGSFALSDTERDVAHASWRSVCAAKDLPEGTCLSLDDLEFKRPGAGIRADSYTQVLGKVTNCNLKADMMITSQCLE